MKGRLANNKSFTILLRLLLLRINENKVICSEYGLQKLLLLEL